MRSDDSTTVSLENVSLDNKNLKYVRSDPLLQNKDNQNLSVNDS